MRRALLEALEATLGAEVTAHRPVGGGDINEAYAVTLATGARIFVKAHRRPPAGFFEAEADGLTLLRGTGAVRVPEVLGVGASDAPFLALEWIDAAPRRPDFDEEFGHALAAMHRVSAPSFGHARDNFIGTLPQANAPTARWPEFYRERRLVPLIARADAGLSAETRRGLAALLERVDELAASDEPPAVVHGDLWSGNVMADERGLPCLVDPAAYAGHREIDLAMLMLFGAPSPRFFGAYDEVYPRAPGFASRVPLYQLDFLLVHVALFGASYRPAVSRALEDLG